MPSHKLRHILSSFLITHVNGIFNLYFHERLQFRSSIITFSTHTPSPFTKFPIQANTLTQLILHPCSRSRKNPGHKRNSHPRFSTNQGQQMSGVFFFFLPFFFFSWSLVNTNIGGAIKLRRKSGVLVALDPVIVAVFVDGPGRQYSSAPDTSTPDVIRSTTLLDFNFVRRPNYRVHAASCRSVA